MEEHDYSKRLNKRPFRLWFEKQWQEHLLEKRDLCEPVDYNREEFFHRYKKHLVKDFKNQRK